MKTADETIALGGAPPAVAAPRTVPSQRIASVDWMRGVVMILMVIDHVSMAFDAHHLTLDSAMTRGAATAALPAGEFLTRWITHLCAPTFVFLAGASLAISVERRVERGVDAREIDRSMLIRGALIALLDPTLVSLGSGRWTFQVLFAIGVCMMLMAPLRRLPTWLLSTLALGWIVLGEIPTGWVWAPPGSSSIPAALAVATYGAPDLVIKYPVIPWLSVMALGWVFGRHLVRYASGRAKVSGKAVLWTCGVAGLAVFFAVRYFSGYGNMFLLRTDDSWQRWLQVSKYPPSLSYMALELGLLCLGLALLRTIELRTRVRPNGVLLVYGETAMFFYIVHRLVLEVPATYFGLRGAGDLATTYIVAPILLAALYPACLWYRGFKAAHRNSILKYF
jgi:uncharacterized membrane protein